MHAVANLLMRAEQLGIKLWVENGDLRYRGRAGKIPRDLLEDLGAHRASLLEHLSRTDAAPSTANDLVPAFGRRVVEQGRVRSFRQASWFALKEKLNGVDSTNCRFVVRIRGYLDMSAMLAAFHDLRRDHEILSATVTEVNGQPWLVYGTQQDWEVERRDVSNLASAQRETAARTAAAELVWRTLDVTTGPLFRAFVITLDDEDHVLGFVMHHLITDTISMRILSERLVRNYSLKVAGHSPAAQEESLRYSDYLQCLDEWVAQPAVRARLREWGDRFANAPAMDLVNQPPQPPTADRNCTRYSFEVSAELTSAVGSTARQLRTSAFVLLLSVQELLLAALTGNDKVVMGAVVSGRELPALTPMIGYLADRLHWITELDGDPTFVEAVARVNDSYTQAMRFQFFRSDIVQQELLSRGKWLHAPVFSFMPYARPRAHMANDRLSRFDVGPAPFSTIPLPGITYWLALSETPQLMRGDIRLPHGSAKIFVERFLATLDMVMKDRSVRLSAVRQALRRG